MWTGTGMSFIPAWFVFQAERGNTLPKHGYPSRDLHTRRDMPSSRAALVSLDPGSIHAVAVSRPIPSPKKVRPNQKFKKWVVKYSLILPGMDLIPWSRNSRHLFGGVTSGWYALHS